MHGPTHIKIKVQNILCPLDNGDITDSNLCLVLVVSLFPKYSLGCNTYFTRNTKYCGYEMYMFFMEMFFNKDLWRVTEQEDINLEIRKRKFRWIGHTLRKEDGGNIKSGPTMEPSRKQEERKT